MTALLLASLFACPAVGPVRVLKTGATVVQRGLVRVHDCVDPLCGVPAKRRWPVEF